MLLLALAFLLYCDDTTQSTELFSLSVLFSSLSTWYLYR